jgi:hypothetical protein
MLSIRNIYFFKTKIYENRHFDVFADIFQSTLEDYKIDVDIRKEIQTFWSSLRPQIV